MAVESKRVLRKILRKRRRRRGIPDDLSQDTEEPTVEPRDTDEPSDVVKLQKMVGNQGIQRLISDEQDDSGPGEDDNKQAQIAKVVENFKASPHYETLADAYSSTLVDSALQKLGSDTHQIVKLYEYKRASFPLLARAVKMKLDSEGQQTPASTAEKQNNQSRDAGSNTFPWLRSVRGSTSRVMIPDPPPAPPEPVKTDQKGEPTEDLNSTPDEKQDPREKKKVEEFFSDSIIETTVEGKLAIDALITGSYRAIPQDLLEEFTRMSDYFQITRTQLSDRTRTTAKEAATMFKKLTEETTTAAKNASADPMKMMGGASQEIKDSTLKLALEARQAITDLLLNKPKEADKKTKDKTAEQEKEIKEKEEAAPAALPDVGGIKAMGFIMTYNSFSGEYRTSSKGIRSSDPKTGVFAEERVADDLKGAPGNSTVIILSAYEPIMSRKQAIRNLGAARPDLTVFSCWVQSDLGTNGNLFVNATKGGWKPMGYFK